MLKGIHTYRNDHSIQISSCSPWCLQIFPFPSLIKKIEAYLEERRNIKDPCHLTHTYPDRPVTSPFAKSQIPKEREPREPPKKRGRTESQSSEKTKQNKKSTETSFTVQSSHTHFHIGIHAGNKSTTTTTTTAASTTPSDCSTSKLLLSVQKATLSIQCQGHLIPFSTRIIMVRGGLGWR